MSSPPNKRGRSQQATKGSSLVRGKKRTAAEEATAALDDRERELNAREIAVALREEELVKRAEKLRVFEEKLKETKLELNKRIEELERESKRVTPPSAIRQQTTRAKIDERMKLAVTLNQISETGSDTIRNALARMGKSYQDYYEGNGFLAAGSLYGGIESFLELFGTKERLTRITPVARLLDVIKNLKWQATTEAQDDSVEERAKTMLHAFHGRVRDKKAMSKLMRWLEQHPRLTDLTEDDLADLLWNELPEPEEDLGETSAGLAARFKPPEALHELPDKLTLRNEKLERKMHLADQYDDALDKDFFYQQHGKYNVLLGRALRTVCEAYRIRGGGMGRLDGSRFFFNLFPAGQSGKRKRADLTTVEEVAILIASLDDDQLEDFVGLVDLPEQMEKVATLARDSVELPTASIRDVGAIEKLKELMKELKQSKQRDSIKRFLRTYATKEVPFHKDPIECFSLLEKHIGESILNALFELSRVDRGEALNQDSLQRSLKGFAEIVEQLEDSDLTIRAKERDAFLIAAMLLWKRHSEINKLVNIVDVMKQTYVSLGNIFGKPGKEFPVYDQETGSDEHLWAWPHT